MERTIWSVVLAALLVAAPLAVAAPEDERPGLTAEQLEARARELELQAQELELEHEKQMGDLEIEARRAEIDRHRGRDGGGGAVVLLLCLVINILLTVWVCKDMREQKIGRALWVPIVLLAGVFGAIIYALARIADTRARPASRGRG